MASVLPREVASSEPLYCRNAERIFQPTTPVQHCDEQYDDIHFDLLLDMQERHFWYRGRHRFLRHALSKCLREKLGTRRSAIDLGGGCGGWIKYLQQRPSDFAELALADSSLRALELAGSVVGPEVDRYQIDLRFLGWQNRWDVAFLLDVLEHIPEDAAVLQEICRALRPGGLLFVTTPALKFFWSYNDELVHHVRRYSRADFRRLADEAGLELVRSRYFMTFLSPLLLASRLRAPDVEKMSREEICVHQQKTHRVPAAPLNTMLTAVFASETPLGWWMPFPWGTSILGVFRKP